jgi:hypothetical protein
MGSIAGASFCAEEAPRNGNAASRSLLGTTCSTGDSEFSTELRNLASRRPISAIVVLHIEKFIVNKDGPVQKIDYAIRISYRFPSRLRILPKVGVVEILGQRATVVRGAFGSHGERNGVVFPPTVVQASSASAVWAAFDTGPGSILNTCQALDDLFLCGSDPINLIEQVCLVQFMNVCMYVCLFVRMWVGRYV